MSYMSVTTYSGRSANSLSPVVVAVASAFAVSLPAAAFSLPVGDPPAPIIPFGCWAIATTSFSFPLAVSHTLEKLEKVNLLPLQQW